MLAEWVLYGLVTAGALSAVIYLLALTPDAADLNTSRLRMLSADRNSDLGHSQVPGDRQRYSLEVAGDQLGDVDILSGCSDTIREWLSTVWDIYTDDPNLDLTVMPITEPDPAGFRDYEVALRAQDGSQPFPYSTRLLVARNSLLDRSTTFRAAPTAFIEFLQCVEY